MGIIYFHLLSKTQLLLPSKFPDSTFGGYSPFRPLSAGVTLLLGKKSVSVSTDALLSLQNYYQPQNRRVL